MAVMGDGKFLLEMVGIKEWGCWVYNEGCEIVKVPLTFPREENNIY